MNNSKILKKEKGVIIVMFLLFLPFLMAFVGLAIDFGYIYATKTKMQNMADAAALAGVPKLQNTTTPKVEDYVKTFLEKNGFEAKGKGDKAALSADNNWNMVYQKVINNADGTKTIQQETVPKDATRLKVNILKKINLLFLPMVSADLASIDLTATATAEGTGVGNVSETDKFQFMTTKSLIIGTTGTAKMYIPSYPKSMKDNGADGVGHEQLHADDNLTHVVKVEGKKDDVTNKYVYKDQFQCDCGNFLKKNVYANDFQFANIGQLRVSGTVYSDNVSSATSHVTTDEEAKGIFFYDSSASILNTIKYNEKNPKGIKSVMANTMYDGKATARDKERIKALVITIPPETKGTYGIGDWNIKGELDKKPGYSTGLDIDVPVIIVYEGSNVVTVSMNVSYYAFKKPLVTFGINLDITGSQQPWNNPWGYSSTYSHTTYSAIYCHIQDLDESDEDGAPLPAVPTKNKGNFSTGGGNCAQKNFTGVVYADSSITIRAVNGHKRHLFDDALISYGDITFVQDGTKATANTFDSVSKDTQIRLVE